jgi:hypothetical protein
VSCKKKCCGLDIIFQSQLPDYIRITYPLVKAKETIFTSDLSCMILSDVLTAKTVDEISMTIKHQRITEYARKCLHRKSAVTHLGEQRTRSIATYFPVPLSILNSNFHVSLCDKIQILSKLELFGEYKVYRNFHSSKNCPDVALWHFITKFYALGILKYQYRGTKCESVTTSSSYERV